MKRLKILIMFFFLVLIIQSELTNASAMETGFLTLELSEEEKTRFLSNVNITLLSLEPQKRGIDCFDVNEYGMIAIGTSESEKKYISIYDSEGIFQYGYTFHSSGSFGLEWSGKNIIIYWVRSDVAACVDSEGELIDISKILNSTENNSYWRNFVFSRERKIGNDRYIMKNGDGVLGFFNPSYSQIIHTNENEDIRIIYEIDESYSVEVLTILIGVILFVGFVIYKMVLEFRKLKSNNISRAS